MAKQGDPKEMWITTPVDLPNEASTPSYFINEFNDNCHLEEEVVAVYKLVGYKTIAKKSKTVISALRTKK